MGSRSIALVVGSLIALASACDDDPEARPTRACEGTACSCPDGALLVNGVCTSPCASKNCGPHATCTVQGTEAVCACNAQYALDAQNTCAWAGGPRDPGFQNTPPNAWTVEGGASIDAAVTGTVDPGLARIQGDERTTVSQVFPMPPYDRAEPLALDVSYFCDRYGKPEGACTSAEATVGIDGRFAYSFFLGPRRVCLGERAFGRDLKISISGRSNAPDETMSIDHVAVVPAPECPAPGTIANGNFEGATGWTPNEHADIAAGAGTNGSRAAHLHRANRCETASITGLISVPATSMKNPALRMKVRGTAGDRMSVTIDNGALATSTGSANLETQTMCLPQWSRGLTLPLSLALPSPALTGCPDIPAQDFVVDDLEIVSDPTCPDVQTVFEGDFERAPSLVSPWTPELHNDSTFTYTTDAGRGAAVLRSPSCSDASMTQALSIPEAEPGKGGPMLRFSYRAVGVNAVFTTPIGGDTMREEWSSFIECIYPPKAMAGRRLAVTFDVRAATTPCSDAALYVDDVEIVHDPGCPEE